jgi:transcriptional regulator with XRE-family HTH domain
MANDNIEWTFEDSLKQYENDPEFIADGLALKFTEEMLQILAQRGLSQSWLAEQMGVSRAHISRILNAQPNITLLTIAKIAVALSVKPDVSLDTKKYKNKLPAASPHPSDFYRYPAKRNPQRRKEALVVHDKNK